MKNYEKDNLNTIEDRLLFTGQLLSIVGYALLGLSKVLRLLKSGEFPSEPIILADVENQKKNESIKSYYE